MKGVPYEYIDGRLLVYVTMVFGDQYNQFIPRFVQRLLTLGLKNFVLFCLDEPAMALCEANAPGRCIPGTPGILNKFTLPLIFLDLGVDVFWLDFDVFLMKDPTPVIIREIERLPLAELFVSGSFADDCICSGLVFFKATDTVATWLRVLLGWMYENVYTHDQKTFSAFLGIDLENKTTPETVSRERLFSRYMNLTQPPWGLLDPVTEFVSARVLNTTGWTGNVEDIVIFHFLHGDSEINLVT